MGLENKNYRGYKIIVCIPAGRRNLLELCINYILKEKIIINECHLWCNTNVKEDINFIDTLVQNDIFFKKIQAKISINGNVSISHFFSDCSDLNAIYIKMDDDICWIEEGALQKLIDFRIDNPC